MRGRHGLQEHPFLPHRKNNSSKRNGHEYGSSRPRVHQRPHHRGTPECEVAGQGIQRVAQPAVQQS